jgi:uncharacterized DUF497 family protein
MKIDFDPAKNALNILDRGLSFEHAAEFDFETADFYPDDRHNYGEDRQIAVGYLDNRLHILCFTTREPDIFRIFSFRKANTREAKKYGKQKTR